MIEQEHQEIGILRIRSAATFERTLVDQFPILISQMKILGRHNNSARAPGMTTSCLAYEILAWSKDQLLIQLSQVEEVFRFPALLVDPGQEFSNDLDCFS